MKLNNKLMAVAIAALLMAGTTITIACDKEEKTVESTTTSAKVHEGVLIGRAISNGIICGVDLDTFSNRIYNSTHTYVAEHFEILDSARRVELYLVLYNTQEGIVESIWLPLQKENGLYYFSPSVAAWGDKYRCVIRQEGCLIGCKRNFNFFGTFTGCSCRDIDGTCHEETVSQQLISSIYSSLNSMTIYL